MIDSSRRRGSSASSRGRKIMNIRHRVVVVSALLAMSVGASACSSDEDDAGDTDGETATESTDISGSVKEWSVSVDAASAPAGAVSFTIENEGTIGHEFLIVKTDIAPGEIPLDGDHFPEDADGIEVIDESVSTPPKRPRSPQRRTRRRHLPVGVQPPGALQQRDVHRLRSRSLSGSARSTNEHSAEISAISSTSRARVSSSSSVHTR